MINWIESSKATEHHGIVNLCGEATKAIFSISLLVTNNGSHMSAQSKHKRGGTKGKQNVSYNLNFYFRT